MPPIVKARPIWRHPLAAVAAVAVVLALAAVAALQTVVGGDQAVDGTVVLTNRTTYKVNGVGCAGLREYASIRQGAQVVITDAAGGTVGIGTLGVDSNKPAGCTFTFSVDITGESDFYGIEVAGRPAVKFPASQLSGLSLSIG